MRSINNQELVYRSRKVNSHATIIRKRGSTVPVLVWEIQPTDEYRLDIYEGYPRYYFKKDKEMPPNNLRKSVAVSTDFIRFTLNKMRRLFPGSS